VAKQSYSDPNTETICKLLGGHTYQGLTFSHDQVKALMRLYSYHHEKDRDGLMEAGMLLSLFRHAGHDGARLMAVLAKWCEPGQDPVKVLVGLLDDAGYDVGGLAEWTEQ